MAVSSLRPGQGLSRDLEALAPRGDRRGAAGCADAEMTRLPLHRWLGGAWGCSFTAGVAWLPPEPLLLRFWPRHPGQRPLCQHSAHTLRLGAGFSILLRGSSLHGDLGRPLPPAVALWCHLLCSDTVSCRDSCPECSPLLWSPGSIYLPTAHTPSHAVPGLLRKPQLSLRVGNGTSPPPLAPGPRTSLVATVRPLCPLTPPEGPRLVRLIFSGLRIGHLCPHLSGPGGISFVTAPCLGLPAGRSFLHGPRWLAQAQ